jgi:hypothetical protein
MPTVLRTLDRHRWSRVMAGNDVVSRLEKVSVETKNRPADGAVLLVGEPQLPALRYCWSTEAGTRPRLESSMPLEAAQARTALRSTAELAFRLVERFPLTLRALLM